MDDDDALAHEPECDWYTPSRACTCPVGDSEKVFAERDREDPREAIGYQRAQKPLPFAQGETFAMGGAPKPPHEVCAVCGQTIVLRCHGECPHCQGVRNRKASDAMGDVIRELKSGRPGADRERHLLKQVRTLGHPDPEGLERALRERWEAGGGGGGRPKRGA